MRRLMTCFSLTLIVAAMPALAVESSNETAPLKSVPEAATPADPEPAPRVVPPPNGAGSENEKSDPSRPSMKEYCREHTC